MLQIQLKGSRDRARRAGQSVKAKEAALCQIRERRSSETAEEREARLQRMSLDQRRRLIGL